jgi:DUF1009 family protein
VTTSLQKLGIIAGGGELPLRIAESCVKRGQPYLVVATDEFAMTFPSHVESERVPLSKLGRGFAALRRHSCRDVVFAGKYERAGFRVVSPLDADPSLAAPRGYITKTHAAGLDDAALRKILLAAKEHGRSDEGQAVVVRDGEVVAREGRRGTDAMLAELKALGGRGGVLSKAMKPDQLRHVDPPVVGVSTIASAAAAGLDGLVIEAGATVVVDQEAVAAGADAAGLFVVGVEA